MRLDTALLQLSLWVTATHAFFPWIPEYANQTKRDEGARGEETVTLQISQRTQDTAEPDSERASRAARYLSRKYNRSDLARRQNNRYSVSKAAPPSAADSASIHQDGTDFSYFVDVGLGSSPKPVYMLLDTGAGTTWVMGSNCKSSACSMHNSFGPEDSKTFQASSKTFSISYGSGSVSGTIASDTMSIAGHKVTVSFGIANTTSDDFTHFPFDGILGMSMSSGATDNVLQVFKREKVLKANIFGVYLNRNSDGPNTGEVTFGGTNPTKLSGTVTYTAVSDKAGGDWAIPLDDFAYDGNKAGISGRLAYIDTGTTYIFGPPSDMAAIHKQIPGAKSSDGVTFTAPCDSSRALTVTFSGVSYTIATKDWLSGPSGSGECVSNLYGHEVVKGSWLMGDAFLKNVYAIFDMNQTRIGFANRLPVAAPPASTSGVASTSSAGSTVALSSSLPSSGGGSPSSTTTPPGPGPASSASVPKPGLGGHETSATTAPGASSAASSSSATTSSPTSASGQLEVTNYLTIALSVFAAMALMS